MLARWYFEPNRYFPFWIIVYIYWSLMYLKLHPRLPFIRFFLHQQFTIPENLWVNLSLLTPEYPGSFSYNNRKNDTHWEYFCLDKSAARKGRVSSMGWGLSLNLKFKSKKNIFEYKNSYSWGFIYGEHWLIWSKSKGVRDLTTEWLTHQGLQTLELISQLKTHLQST